MLFSHGETKKITHTNSIAAAGSTCADYIVIPVVFIPCSIGILGCG
jgi:hypothetical protein